MPQRAVPESLFSDAAFAAAPTELQTLALFALSPAMRDFLLQAAPKYTRSDGPSRGLTEAMRTRRIGRASCRERVCQQVFNSVGADYLKKKKNQTKQQRN